MPRADSLEKTLMLGKIEGGKIRGWQRMRWLDGITDSMNMLEELTLKLKLQYFGHLMWSADSLVKTLILGKIEGRKSRGWQRIRWLGDMTDLMEMGLGGLRKLVMDREAWRDAVHGNTKSCTWMTIWTDWLNFSWISNVRVGIFHIKSWDLDKKGNNEDQTYNCYS